MMINMRRIKRLTPSITLVVFYHSAAVQSISMMYFGNDIFVPLLVSFSYDILNKIMNAARCIAMEHSGTRTLETKRLILRRFTIGDAEDVFRNWAGDDEVTKYLTWPPHKNIEVTKAYIMSLLESYPQPNTYDWAIELKEIGRAIGSISVVRQDEPAGCVHVGYCIGKPWWNKGITSEAFSAVISYLMDEVKVDRIDSRHDPRNIYSGKVMEKCGLKYEGTFKESDENNRGICDAAWYALLRKDYLAAKQSGTV